ncbi:MAG: hypothetical protein HFJ75_06295 [Eggerthellaceae bacterium]|nr:hypothetical protein [Eggerthellaceae bacterium]
MSETVVMDDVYYGTGTFFLAPVISDTQAEEMRGVVTMPADALAALQAKGLMDQKVSLTLVNDDNSMTDTEGWTGLAGLRTVKVGGIDPKPQLLLGREDLDAIIAAGIVDGNIVDVTIAKLA